MSAPLDMAIDVAPMACCACESPTDMTPTFGCLPKTLLYVSSRLMSSSRKYCRSFKAFASASSLLRSACYSALILSKSSGRLGRSSYLCSHATISS